VATLCDVGRRFLGQTYRLGGLECPVVEVNSRDGVVTVGLMVGDTLVRVPADALGQPEAPRRVFWRVLDRAAAWSTGGIETAASAWREAERLSELNRGKRFEVVKVEGYVEHATGPTRVELVGSER
jgi:hypothetical protein